MALGPLLANTIITELERNFVKKFIDNESLTFFDRNLKFTFDTFNNSVPHFLHIEIHPDGLEICCESTNVGQYINHTSFYPWRYKPTSLISFILLQTFVMKENFKVNLKFMTAIFYEILIFFTKL